MAGDAYKEYIPAADLTTSLAIANAFHDGIQAFRSTNYRVIPAFGLYPTADTSDDYAYSRYFVDQSKQKIVSYTLEWGTEFQPPYSEMQNIIQEITCGLLAFCLKVCEMERENCHFCPGFFVFAKTAFEGFGVLTWHIKDSGRARGDVLQTSPQQRCGRS